MYHSFFKISRNIDSHYRQTCREVHGILETSIVQENKKNHMPHVLSDGLGVKIRNEFKFKSVFKGRPQITMTLTRLWCPACVSEKRVWMGSSVLQAHKPWSQSFLFKDFCICIDKSFIRREYSDRPGRKYRGCFVRFGRRNNNPLPP